MWNFSHKECCWFFVLKFLLPVTGLHFLFWWFFWSICGFMNLRWWTTSVTVVSCTFIWKNNKIDLQKLLADQQREIWLQDWSIDFLWIFYRHALKDNLKQEVALSPKSLSKMCISKAFLTPETVMVAVSMRRKKFPTVISRGYCRSIPAKPTCIKKEKDIPRLPEK